MSDFLEIHFLSFAKNTEIVRRWLVGGGRGLSKRWDRILNSYHSFWARITKVGEIGTSGKGFDILVSFLCEHFLHKFWGYLDKGDEGKLHCLTFGVEFGGVFSLLKMMTISASRLCFIIIKTWNLFILLNMQNLLTLFDSVQPQINWQLLIPLQSLHDN